MMTKLYFLLFVAMVLDYLSKRRTKELEKKIEELDRRIRELEDEY